MDVIPATQSQTPAYGLKLSDCPHALSKKNNNKVEEVFLISERKRVRKFQEGLKLVW